MIKVFILIFLIFLKLIFLIFFYYFTNYCHIKFKSKVLLDL